MKSQEVKAYVVEVCTDVIKNLALQKAVEQKELNIRIDMKDLFSKPIFSLFHKSTFLCQCSQNEIIVAGGGKGFGLILGMQIKNIIKSVFSASLNRFEMKDTKEIFVLMYLKSENEKLIPFLAVYKKGEFMDALPVGEIFQNED